MSAFNDEQLAEIKKLVADAIKPLSDELAAVNRGLLAVNGDHFQLRADFESTQNQGGVTADDENSLDNGLRDNQAHHRKDIPQHGGGVRA
jgi:hypothetical protein